MKTFNTILFLLITTFALPALGQYSIFAYRDGPSDDNDGLDSIELAEHANLARCMCDEAAGEGESYSFYLEMQYSGSLESTDHYYYLGSDCSNTAVALDQCAQLATINVNAYQSNQFVPLPVNYLVDPDEGVCSQINSGSNSFYIFSSLEGRTSVFTDSFSFDTEPPTAPFDVTATSGEAALTVKWDNADIDEEGIEYFNVLCMREGLPGEPASESKADWVDTEEVCGKIFDDTNTNNINNTNNTTTTNNTNNTNNTAGTTKSGAWLPAQPSYDNSHNAYVPPSNPPRNYKALTCPTNGVVNGGRPYKCYVCATATRTAGSVRVNGLENDVTYTVAVVAVDKHRNVSLLSNTVTGVPKPTTDFAEQYSSAGGAASGDYCFIATQVYGGKEHAGVQVLRLFRDDILNRSALGRDFVAWYYANGEGWAKYMSDKPLLSFVVKVALLPVIFIAMILIVTPLWGFLLFAGFIWALYNRKRLRALFAKVSMKYAA